MKVTEQFKIQYLSYLKSYLPPDIVRGPEFQTSVFTSLDELVELSTPKVCEARKKGLAPSCEPSDLAERTLKLASGKELIAGARFKNLNVEFPFIEIHLGAEMRPEILDQISAIVQIEFKNLRPKGMKFKDSPNAYNFEKWSHTVFGKIENQDVPQIPLNLSFSFSDNLAWHEQYITEYQERLAENAVLDGFVRIGQLDEFQESVADEALMIANDADGFCGVIAGIKSPLYGLSAIYMIESYLSRRWTGRKLAPIAHAFFLNEIALRYKYVWGTIYDKNLSSLNTALRVGRRAIETEYFVRFNV